jgi:hypothetical protein
MDGKVTLGFEDGSSQVFSNSAVLVFIDETGQEGLLDKEFPIFGFGGCLTFVTDYENAIVKPWKAVEQTIPSNMLPLHASELNPKLLPTESKEALNGFFTQNVFGRFAAVCSNKTINTRPEIETISMMAGTVYKRIQDILQRIINHGLAFSELVMIFEKSERTKYKISHYFSQYELQFMSTKIPVHRYFLTKGPNEPGLVVADFIAHTAGSTVNSKRREKISQSLERRDFKNVFAPIDDRWVSYLEIDEVK